MYYDESITKLCALLLFSPSAGRLPSAMTKAAQISIVSQLGQTEIFTQHTIFIIFLSCSVRVCLYKTEVKTGSKLSIII